MNRYSVLALLGLAATAPSQASVVITMQPQDQTVVEWHLALFEVQAEGMSPLYYQGEKNDWAIPGANSASYTTPLVSLADDGSQFRVVVSDLESSITSATARLSVIPDVEPPFLVAVEPLPTLDGVLVRFNEPVNVQSASDPFNYQVWELPNLEPLLVAGCSMSAVDQTQLRLDPATSLKRNTDYWLEVWNVEDLSGNPLSYATHTFHVTIAPAVPGDVTKDGRVNEEDAQTLAAHWGCPGGWAEGDFDEDGIVGPRDASILAANWGYGTEESGESNTVPEPNVLVTLLGMAGLMLLCRRQRKL